MPTVPASIPGPHTTGVNVPNELLVRIMSGSNGWTPERRARQAEAIRRWQPWARSTGPRTAEGKAVSARNADKGGQREEERARNRQFRAQLKLLKHVIARDGIKPLGPPDQVGRRRRRSAKEQARYDEELVRLYLEAEGLTGLLDDDEGEPQ